MTKSDYIRSRIKPLIRMIQPFVHEEDKDSIAVKVEIWALRLIADVEQLGAMDISEYSDNQPYTEEL